MVWLQGLTCGAVVTLAPGVALLLALLLGPGLLAVLLDREPGRPMARCVLLMGVATCVQPLRILWADGGSAAAALALAADLQVLGTAWSAAAAGWLLAELAPLGTRLVLEALARSRAAKLRAERERLLAEWGAEDAEGG
jgi:hypothetical protein